MCETFKWIKLLVIESQNDGLQIPAKISLGKKWLLIILMMVIPCQSIYHMF